MAQVFRQALPAQPPEQSVYEMMLRELQQQPQPQAPAFDPNEVRQRIAQNNAQANLGLLGQMSGDEGMQNIGGTIFKKALSDRAERVTNRGVQDPLTGETQIDPEYRAEQEGQRRGRIFERALAYEGQRTSARERAEQASAARAEQANLRRELAAGRNGTNNALDTLKAENIRSQIDARQAGIDVKNEKIAAGQEKQRLAVDGANAKADLVTSTIDKALSQAGFMSTGLVGAGMGIIPGSGAYDLRKTVDTVKANIGFQELQEMRQASPTGGALGQVAVKELDMLQATLGNLDPNQSEDQLKQNLTSIKTSVQRWRDAVRASQDRSVSRAGSGVSPSPMSPDQPLPGAVPAQPSPGTSQMPPAQPPARRRFNPATGRLE